MKKIKGFGAVLAGVALFCLSALPAAADPPGFETYVVKHGDTLSRIAGRVFGDVNRWREILKANPQVKNANLIYPGDALRVPVAVAKTTPGPAPELTARPGAESGLAGSGMAPPSPSSLATVVEPPAPPPPAAPPAPPAPPEKKAPSPPLVNPAFLRASGYIADSLPTIAIIGAEDDRLLIANNDAAIVNASLATGARFAVVRADRRVFHPKTGVCLGWLVRVLGSAEVTCRNERTSTVRLRGMRDAGGVGDYLLPADPEPPAQFVLAGKSVPECVPAGAEDGLIVAFDEERLISGEMDLAYIDRGTGSGAAPGQIYTIYRESRPEGPVAVGELQVLRAAERTATALITTSHKEVHVGDLLRVK